MDLYFFRAVCPNPSGYGPDSYQANKYWSHKYRSQQITVAQLSVVAKLYFHSQLTSISDRQLSDTTNPTFIHNKHLYQTDKYHYHTHWSHKHRLQLNKHHVHIAQTFMLHSRYSNFETDIFSGSVATIILLRTSMITHFWDWVKVRSWLNDRISKPKVDIDVEINAHVPECQDNHTIHPCMLVSTCFRIIWMWTTFAMCMLCL